MTAGLNRCQTVRSRTCPWRVVGLLVGLVLVLALVARGSTTLRIDAETTVRVQNLDGAFFSALADLGNAIGDVRIALPLAVLAAIVAAVTKSWRELAFLIVLMLLRGSATILKDLLDSPRPTAAVAEIVGTYEGLGFPSGHSVTSSVAVGGGVFLALRMAATRSAHVALALGWMICVTLTGYARVWVGAHWLTDTIGGTMIGATIVLVSANLSTLIAPRRAASSG